MIGKTSATALTLNERAVRANAGIMFLLGLFAFMQAFYLQEYLLIKVVVVLFFVDFSIKVFVGPRWSPLGLVARRVVRGQTPEPVPYSPKRMAWSIGLVLSGTMIVLLFGLGVQGLPNLVVCSVCLTFMFSEAAFAICPGCLLYEWLLHRGWAPF